MIATTYTCDISNSKQQWKVYFDSLPASFINPMYINPKQVDQLLASAGAGKDGWGAKVEAAARERRKDSSIGGSVSFLQPKDQMRLRR